mmetsp:Transcript_24011/g.73976  ORF Transcript_24011/g.73976 Transcript_24011/m.73976 type:complete len:194 (-) Transcript_24011:319-900(-)
MAIDATCYNDAAPEREGAAAGKKTTEEANEKRAAVAAYAAAAQGLEAEGEEKVPRPSGDARLALVSYHREGEEDAQLALAFPQREMAVAAIVHLGRTASNAEGEVFAVDLCCDSNRFRLKRVDVVAASTGKAPHTQLRTYGPFEWYLEGVVHESSYVFLTKYVKAYDNTTADVVAKIVLGRVARLRFEFFRSR